jgi:hypothetical protein
LTEAVREHAVRGDRRAMAARRTAIAPRFDRDGDGALAPGKVDAARTTRRERMHR